MITTLLHLLRLFPFLCGGHRQLALENLALRQQLAVYKRTAKRPKLSRRDRLFWVWLSGVWAGWLERLATWKSHITEKLDQAALKLEEPQLFAKFVRPSMSRSFRLQ
jgi:hypothetical protein